MSELLSHDCPCLYVPRSAWGLTDTEASRRGLIVQPLNRLELYVHHQGAGSHENDPIAWARALDRYATKTKGYKAVDYNLGVTGTPGGGVAVVEMRGRYIGGATQDRNTASKSLCLSGNRTAIGPNGLERDAIRWAAFAMRRSGWLSGDHQTLGHRDNPAHPNATSCPGDAAYGSLPALRVPWGPKPPPLPGDDLMPQFVRDQANPHRILERLPGGAYVDVDDQDVFDVLGVDANALPVRAIAAWLVVPRETLHLPARQ